jgi:hypothetical protein
MEVTDDQPSIELDISLELDATSDTGAMLRTSEVVSGNELVGAEFAVGAVTYESIDVWECSAWTCQIDCICASWEAK